MRLDILFGGFPGRSNRGFLGWSSCVLIRTDDAPPVLFDTGGFNERYVLKERLESLGVSPGDIGSVFLSHFHFDHVANCSMFKRATFYLHEREARYVKRCGHEDLAVPVEIFLSVGAGGRLSLLSGPSGTAAGIKWLATPGHTPGSLSLLLEYRGRRWALASDAVKNRLELLTGHAAMTRDPEKSRRSIEAVGAWADVVVPGHDALLAVVREEGGLRVREEVPTVVELTVAVNGETEKSCSLSTAGLW